MKIGVLQQMDSWKIEYDKQFSILYFSKINRAGQVNELSSSY